MRSLENSKINTVKITEWKTWQILGLRKPLKHLQMFHVAPFLEQKFTKVKTMHTIKENKSWTDEAAQWVKVLAPSASILVPRHKYVHMHTSTHNK